MVILPISHYLTYTFLVKGDGRTYLLNLEVKGLNRELYVLSVYLYNQHKTECLFCRESLVQLRPKLASCTKSKSSSNRQVPLIACC